MLCRITSMFYKNNFREEKIVLNGCWNTNNARSLDSLVTTYNSLSLTINPKSV